MTYTRGILTRFGEDVSKNRTIDGADFMDAVGKIEYDSPAVSNLQTCSADAVERVLRGTQIEYLSGELVQRWHEFWTPEDQNAVTMEG